MNLVKIVPVQCAEGFPQKTQGTQGLVDGVKIGGVQKIVLTADMDDVWRAEIHCMAYAPNLDGAICKLVHRKIPAWKRIIARMIGIKLDSTSFDSEAREYADP